jgi:hypothetical protein
MSMWDMESRYVKAMEFARATFLKSLYDEAFQEGVKRGRFEERISKVSPCRHERTNEDGICRQCGSDCRGAGGGA